MYEEENDQVDSFITFVVYFVESYTDFHNVRKMTPEKFEKYVTKLTLLIIFETSPRKNYDISMASIKEFVRDILEKRLGRR